VAVQELQVAAADRVVQIYVGGLRGVERRSFARDGERMGKRGFEHAG